ncbi:MAG TPA: SDR family NAD(P)-dependent oxidoreductase [Candidatus Dormibacteraeota bacterium]|nr:SDR family NAD(P)-dependent oxidoreductase [Candidatus Dormibacteraeota bacterium]
MRLKGAVVVITGASSGIGEAAALAFARKRANLVLGARRVEQLNAVAQKCREKGAPEVTVRRLDVGHRTEARAFVAAALRDHERIDVLVNNAGVGWMGRLHEMPDGSIDELLATNLKGTITTTQAALPSMLAHRRGVIINVSSVLGFRAAPYSAVYSATKHAIVGFSHALRGELSGTGIKVCVVYPASTETEFFAQTEAPIGPQYPAWWVANTIVRAARFPRRDVMVLPYRFVHMAEPFLGGLLDHTLGEARRKKSPHLMGTGLPPVEDAEELGR